LEFHKEDLDNQGESGGRLADGRSLPQEGTPRTEDIQSAGLEALKGSAPLGYRHPAMANPPGKSMGYDDREHNDPMRGPVGSGLFDGVGSVLGLTDEVLGSQGTASAIVAMDMRRHEVVPQHGSS